MEGEIMDTSETYIKMRLAAIPDLGMGKPPELVPNTEVTWLTQFVFVDRMGNLYYSDKEQTCQLERQDQLQEMVSEDWNYLLFLMDEFLTDVEGTVDLDYVASMEQLWLGFVMKELHGKVWAGEKWEEAKVTA